MINPGLPVQGLLDTITRPHIISIILKPSMCSGNLPVNKYPVDFCNKILYFFRKATFFIMWRLATTDISL